MNFTEVFLKLLNYFKFFSILPFLSSTMNYKYHKLILAFSLCKICTYGLAEHKSISERFLVDRHLHHEYS